METKRLAEIWNGREYGEEITKEQIDVAKASWLIVIFGASDDTVIIKGAIDEEMWVSDEENTIYNFTKDWKLVLDYDNLFEGELDQSDINSNTLDILSDFYKEFIKTTSEFVAEFDKNWYSWFITTENEHSTFDIMEDWEKFCRGIVLKLKTNTEAGENYEFGEDIKTDSTVSIEKGINV